MDNGTDNSYMIWVTCCKINDKRHILAKVRLLESVEANHDSLGCSSLLLHPNSPCDPILQGMGSCSRSWFQVRMHLSLGQVIKCAALSILLRMMCNDKINIYIMIIKSYQIQIPAIMKLLPLSDTRIELFIPCIESRHAKNMLWAHIRKAPLVGFFLHLALVFALDVPNG